MRGSAPGTPGRKTADGRFQRILPRRPRYSGKMLLEMLGAGENIWIEPPFYFCYGTHIFIGDGSYLNFNCNFVDDGTITIGKNSVIGAGAVVTQDIPAGSVAVGNPCRVLRQIGPEDQDVYFRGRKIDPADLALEAALRKNP